MKNRFVKTITIALITLMLSQGASAFALGLLQSLVQELAKIFAWGLANPVDAISMLLIAIIKANPCVYPGSGAGDMCIMYGIAVPADATIREFNVNLIRYFAPVYIALFLLTGLYMILMQGSPKGRAQAKAFFIDLTVGMVLVVLSPLIFQIILNISSALTEEIWTRAGVGFGDIRQFWQTPGEMVTYCCFLTIAIVGGVCAAISAGMRYFAVMVFAALFPLTVFLYSFRFTKNMGNAMMRFTFLAIFSQVIQAFFLVIGIMMLNEGTGLSAIVKILLGLASMVAVISTPLIVLKTMHWLGGAIYAYSSRGGGVGVRAISQLMRGRSIGDAIVTAGGRYQTTHTLGMYERGGERMAASGWGKDAEAWSIEGEYPGFPHGGIIGKSHEEGVGRAARHRRSGSTISGAGGRIGASGGGGLSVPLSEAIDSGTLSRTRMPTAAYTPGMNAGRRSGAAKTGGVGGGRMMQGEGLSGETSSGKGAGFGKPPASGGGRPFSQGGRKPAGGQSGEEGGQTESGLAARGSSPGRDAGGAGRGFGGSSRMPGSLGVLQDASGAGMRDGFEGFSREASGDATVIPPTEEAATGIGEGFNAEGVEGEEDLSVYDYDAEGRVRFLKDEAQKRREALERIDEGSESHLDRMVEEEAVRKATFMKGFLRPTTPKPLSEERMTDLEKRKQLDELFKSIQWENMEHAKKLLGEYDSPGSEKERILRSVKDSGNPDKTLRRMLGIEGE